MGKHRQASGKASHTCRPASGRMHRGGIKGHVGGQMKAGEEVGLWKGGLASGDGLGLCLYCLSPLPLTTTTPTCGTVAS